MLPPSPRTERQSKADIYRDVASAITAVLDGETDRIARMATVTALLKDRFDTYFWAGFYVVDPVKQNELVVGPYQGTLGCLRISYGRGVCGAAAATRTTQIVPDVHAFPGHIACDSRSNSEIVVPVFDADNQLIAVFDVDSMSFSAFDDTDAFWLEQILKTTFQM